MGDDFQGLAVRHGFDRAGVETRFLATDPGRPTSTTILSVRSCGQRSNYHMVGASLFFGIEPALLKALPGVRAVYWGAVNLPGVARDAPEFLRKARAAGAFVTCDLVSPRDGTLEDLARILPHVDLFMRSLAELRAINGDEDLPGAAQRFMVMGAGACVFKLGHERSVLFGADRTIAMPLLPITPIDTTTCGDSFCSGFHAARLRGYDEEHCLRFATATAAQVAMGLGTLGKLGSFDETLALADTIPATPRV